MIKNPDSYLCHTDQGKLINICRLDIILAISTSMGKINCWEMYECQYFFQHVTVKQLLQIGRAHV